ncbi:40S ribosomal protein S5-1 [Hordeum vulgare]|nr:40S ribosomal protein S5-1 [Hordeum vulgare]
MTSPKVLKDKFFEKVINPYLTGVLQHPQSIEMHEGVLHIRDVEGPKKTGSMEARLEAMEQQVFKCQGMVERGLNTNHMMITEFTNKHKIDANDIGKHLSRLYDRIDHLQAQIYDVQNQNCELRRAPLDESCPSHISHNIDNLCELFNKPSHDDARVFNDYPHEVLDCIDPPSFGGAATSSGAYDFCILVEEMVTGSTTSPPPPEPRRAQPPSWLAPAPPILFAPCCEG